MYLLLSIHWVACIYYSVSEYEGFGINSWVFPKYEVDDPNNNLHRFVLFALLLMLQFILLFVLLIVLLFVPLSIWASVCLYFCAFLFPSPKTQTTAQSTSYLQGTSI